MQSKKTDRGPSQRQLRAGEVIRKALAEVFLTLDIQDPELAGVILTVTEVSVSPDLRSAKAYIMPLNIDDGAGTVDVLRRHRKFLRGEVARRVRLKYMPQIDFSLDLSYEHSSRIDELLRSPGVARDLRGSNGS